MARPTAREQVKDLLRRGQMLPLYEVRATYPGPATDKAILDLIDAREIWSEPLDDEIVYLGWASARAL
jgi:hypothetical protein